MALHAAHPFVFQPLEGLLLFAGKIFVDSEDIGEFTRCHFLLELLDHLGIPAMRGRWSSLLGVLVVRVSPFMTARGALQVACHAGILSSAAAARTIASFGVCKIVPCFFSALSQPAKACHVRVLNFAFYQCFVSRQWTVLSSRIE